MLYYFSVADYLILTIISISALISFMRGFIHETISLVMWVLAIWCALSFAHILAERLTHIIHTPSLRSIASFSIIFIAVLLSGGLFNFLLVKFMHHTGLSSIDRWLGVIFGVIRAILLIALLIMLLQHTAVINDKWWQGSILIPHFKFMVDWINKILPQHLQHFFKSN